MREVSAVLILSLLFFHLSAEAFNLGQLQGGIRQEFISPNNLHELCVVPKKWVNGDYSKGDIKKETEMCNTNFYTDVGICPKYSSTNPAVLTIKPTSKYSKDAINASHCDIDKLNLSSEAKFKQTITCSSAASILAYYQVSRALGDINRVPVSVIRTMDAGIHKKLADKAVAYLKGSGRYTEITWQLMQKVHANPANYPTVVDETHTQIFGALVDNIKKEEKYTEVSGKGSYDTRYSRFLKQPPFLRVANANKVTDIVGSSEFAKVAQTVVQMKDVSDMILLDTLLNQQDRIGNIHYKFVWFYVDPSTQKLEKKKSDAKLENEQIVVPPDEIAEMTGKPAALVKEMTLKDNDCGVTKTNMMKKFQVLDKVRHMSYRTYRKFLAFEQSLSLPEAKSYFTKELLFTDSDFRYLKRNAQAAKQLLKSRCESKQLQFDVDLELYIPGAPAWNTQC